jgi:hypothetical protein
MYSSLHWNTVSFAFDAPIRETGYLAETFDLGKKSAYATLGIQELIYSKDYIVLQIVLWAIFSTLSKTAKIQKLDYIQNITLNGVEVWCIDDGESICLMTKGEY